MVRILGVMAVALAVLVSLIAWDVSTASAQDEGTPIIVAEDQTADSVVSVEDAEAVTDTGVPVASEGVVVDPSVLANAVTDPVVVYATIAGIIASFVTAFVIKPSMPDQLKMGVWMVTSAILGCGYYFVEQYKATELVMTAAGVATVAIAFYRLNPTAMRGIQAKWGLTDKT